MKKILTLLLALAIIFALACPAFAVEDVENFLKADAKWEKGTAKGTVSVTDGVARCTGIDNEWCCPSIDILPTVKEAIGTEDEIEITISFEVRANFSEGNEGSTSSARVLMRGANGISGLGGADNADAWLEAYDDSLDGEDRLFSNSKGNLLKYLDGGAQIEISDEWTRYTAKPMFLYSAQVNNPSVIKWNLTLDKIIEFAIIDSLEFRNVIVTTEEIEVEDDDEGTEDPETDAPAADEPAADEPATDAPAADDKPATDTPADSATQKPAVATPGATDAPVANNNAPVSFNATAVLVTAIASATVIIVACIVAIVIVKKKTSK